MKALLVYCGSSDAVGASFRAAARAVGTEAARRGWRLIYGGGRTGLMGEVADAALAAGGLVTGVIPRAMMSREIAHDGLTELHVVADMHGRKAMMLELADAVLALPGGVGTLEEWFEAVTWWSLGYHPKPCALLNTDGYYDALAAQLARMHQDGFLRESVWRAVRIGTRPEPLLEELAQG